jgi:hypothetical protein
MTCASGQLATNIRVITIGLACHLWLTVFLLLPLLHFCLVQGTTRLQGEQSMVVTSYGVAMQCQCASSTGCPCLRCCSWAARCISCWLEPSGMYSVLCVNDTMTQDLYGLFCCCCWYCCSCVHLCKNAGRTRPSGELQHNKVHVWDCNAPQH